MSDTFKYSQGNTAVIVGVIVAVVLILGAVLLFTRNNEDSDEVGDTNVDTVVPTDEPVAEEDLTAISPAPVEESPSVSPTAATQGAVKEFTVSGRSFRFTPAEIRVKTGDTVRITFKNEEGMHDLRLDEFNVATKVIPGGQQETVEFVANKAGQYEYYCSVGQHRQLGMKGTLIVE